MLVVVHMLVHVREEHADEEAHLLITSRAACEKGPRDHHEEVLLEPAVLLDVHLAAAAAARTRRKSLGTLAVAPLLL